MIKMPPLDSPASKEAMRRRLAYEQEVSSTPLGRRSWEMRQQAIDLVRRHREEEAFALYAKAADLHTPDDVSAAAAMCWYDLAETYERRTQGVRVANLRAAEGLFRRALRCPAVEEDWHRAAMVRSSLASCLRHLAQQPIADSAEESLLNEAQQLFEVAIGFARRGSSVEYEGVARYLHNLANLHAQRGRLEQATDVLNEAEDYARKLREGEEAGGKAALLASILCHTAQYHRLLGATDKALMKAREGLALAHPLWVDRLQLEVAMMLVESGPASREQAIVELRRVRAERLHPDLLPPLIDLYVRAGLRHEALLHLHRKIDQAIGARRDTIADHVADDQAIRAQEAAHLAARLHIEEGDAMKAFLTLEHPSGMRFSEVIEPYCIRSGNPIAQELQRRFHQAGTVASMLERDADVFAMAGEDVHKLLSATCDSLRAKAGLDTGFDHGGIDFQAPVLDALDRASRHPDPVGFLRRRVRDFVEEATHAQQHAVKVDHALDPLARPWIFPPTPELLRTLLQEHTGHVLMRFSLTTDLLVIAIWLEGEEVVAKAHRLVMPPRLLLNLARYQSDPNGAPHEAIAADLASLDLSPVLPEGRMNHAVLLPSHLASFLPLVALGAGERTLLDRFQAISWMSCLTPLFDRQAPHPPRTGVVTVAPGGTLHHAVALRLALPSEQRLEARAATLDRVLEAARSADVLCFYTHGRHAGEHGPELDLRDGQLDRTRLDARWGGIERIELWACQSGVNLPHQPLTPPVDEMFGLDNEFLRVGVRSAIGTLWKVPDLVTACMVHRYRQALLEGHPAPRALAEAQRFWRDEGARSLGDHLRRLDDQNAAARAFFQTLGISELENASSIEAQLNADMAEGTLPNGVEQLIARLANPLSWAGFRFAGVAERRPVRPWNDDDARPLTDAEKSEVERLLAKKKDPGVVVDEWQEEQLAEATAVKAGNRPSPDRAIRVARLYRDRMFSSHRHNLLAGLAWLHEAMESLSETVKDAKARKQARQQLSLEAAWLWFEIARGEAVAGIDLLLVPPAPVATTRARRLLESLPEGPHLRVLRAWVGLLDADLSLSANLETTVTRAWQAIDATVRSPLDRGYEGTRSLAAACELLLLASKPLPDAAKLCIAAAKEHLKHAGRKLGQVVCAQRLQSAAALLERRAGIESSISPGEVGLLPPREQACVTVELFHQLMRAEAEQALFVRDRFNKGIDALEGNMWGYPDDDRTPLWRSTGTLGAAYRRVTATWLETMALATGAEAQATQFIGCLQAAADLRVAPLSRWTRFGDGPGGRLGQFAVFVRDRETLFDVLEEAALLPDVRRFEPGERPVRFDPHPLDPFKRSASEIQRGSTTDDLVPWRFGDACGWYHQWGAPDAHTAAFSAIRAIDGLTRATTGIWRAISEGAARKPDGRALPSEVFDPGIRLNDREDLLRAMPPGVVVLGLSVGRSGTLVAATVWNDGAAFQQRVRVTADAAGMRLQDLLAKLHWPANVAEASAEGLPRRRRDVWEQLRRVIEPTLDAVLGPALAKGPLRVALLAPGSLRPLPILGLHVAGRPLYASAAGVLHLPSLSAEPKPDGGDEHVCLLGGERGASDVCFGEAVTETLRRWTGAHVLRPPQEATRRIVEGDQLETFAARLGSLRLYGVETPAAVSPVMYGMGIPWGRVFSDMNVRGSFLPRCELVEIWAATAGSSPAFTIRRDDRDRIPGLARSFLLSGAAHVLDLAWPVHDLIKAMVCERFGILRCMQTAPVPELLAASIAWVAEALRVWRDACAGLSSLPRALERLDELRRGSARGAGLDARAVVPFSRLADSSALAGHTLKEILEETGSADNFAAFRVWGWFQR
jgi:tetratricopeptide (TPR) repeat protein